MPVQFTNGKVLFRDGKVAMDPAYCCEEPPNRSCLACPLVGDDVRLTFANVRLMACDYLNYGGGAIGHVPVGNVNGTWDLARDPAVGSECIWRGTVPGLVVHQYFNGGGGQACPDSSTPGYLAHTFTVDAAITLTLTNLRVFGTSTWGTGTYGFTWFDRSIGFNQRWCNLAGPQFVGLADGYDFTGQGRPSCADATTMGNQSNLRLTCNGAATLVPL